MATLKHYRGPYIWYPPPRSTAMDSPYAVYPMVPNTETEDYADTFDRIRMNVAVMQARGLI